jgi:hypothetical protein
MQTKITQVRHALKPMVGVLFVLGILAAQSVKADGPFTNASLHGKYAYANNTGGVGSFGPMTFDGKGEVTIALTINSPCDQPATSCARTIVETNGSGPYTVKPDGTGIATITFDLPSVGTDKFDFIISKSTNKAGILIATQLFAVDEDGGLAGQLVAPTWSRVSD